jgi:CRP-like cAMP-binding protein
MRNLGAFNALSAAEMAILSDLLTRRRQFPQGRDLVRQGQPDQAAFILSDGWACSYKILPDGSRQILNFQVPGDFLGLRSVLLRSADYSAVPLTPVEAAEVTAADLQSILAQTPRLAMALLWAASRDEAMLVERLVSMGRRSAVERTAHLLLELGVRLRLAGLAGKGGYDCPLSQYLLADALGLSAVHVNRVLRQLREEGWLTFQRGHVTIPDFDCLADRFAFNTDYLDQFHPALA